MEVDGFVFKRKRKAPEPLNDSTNVGKLACRVSTLGGSGAVNLDCILRWNSPSLTATRQYKIVPAKKKTRSRFGPQYP